MKKAFEHYFLSAKLSVLWITFAVIVGGVVGAAGGLFALAIEHATAFRGEHPQILYLLPFAGLLIVLLYHLAHMENDKGTNTIINAIHERNPLRAVTAPLIFAATVLTHLFGGSAGREGAALQLGGSLSYTVSRILPIKFEEKDRKKIIMCGMAAAFSALFGTPMAAAIFAMEVSTVGIIHNTALVPCVISSLVAHFVAVQMGVPAEVMPLTQVAPFTFKTMVLTVILALLSSAVAILFVRSISVTGHFMHKYFKNPYIKAFCAGCVIIVLTLLVGSQTYNGGGMNIIMRCIEENGEGVFLGAFLLKMLFTVITLEGGFKGGEIVPAFFIGATMGNAFGQLTGAHPALCAAIGMCCLFCAVTNCPIASLLICFELFGFTARPYFLLAIALTYIFSGNFGLYSSQVIRFSKYESGKRVDYNVHH